MKHSKRAKDLALTAGALAAGVAGCSDGFSPCDPPPPPLCSRLGRESSLRVIADRDTIPLSETVTFECMVTDTVVSAIERVTVSPEVGINSDPILRSPRSFTFSWGPREYDGTFARGQARIELELRVRGTLDGETNTCWLSGEIVVRIDDDGTAVVVSLPEPEQPLAVHFDVRVEASADGDAVLLKAIPTLTRGESRRAIYRWRASAGAIEPTGDQARFVPPSDGASAVVQVEAVLDGSSLAVGVWEWRGR